MKMITMYYCSDQGTVEKVIVQCEVGKIREIESIRCFTIISIKKKHSLKKKIKFNEKKIFGIFT